MPLTYGSTACSTGPDHQGPHHPEAGLRWPHGKSDKIGLPTSTILQGPVRASASAQPPVAQWVAPAKEESYFYLFLLNHELNLAANQVTMVICTGFTAVS